MSEIDTMMSKTEIDTLMSKTVAIIPSTVTKEDAELLRAQRVAACFWQLLAAARSQIDGVNWHQLGLHEAEAAMQAWERGEQHAFFRTWEARKATVGANRPAPTAVELEARRWVLLMCRALERTGLGRKEAREFAAKELQRIDLYSRPLTARMIERWDGQQPLKLTPKDEQVLATGIAVCGRGAPHKLALYFVGLLHLVLDPAVRVRIE
jgi:hypothetical protein